MQAFVSDEFVQYVASIEEELSGLTLFPEFIALDKDKSKIGPYAVSRIWFDYQDETQQLGITYTESSVKNNKQIDIFKPIRSPGVPLAIIPIFIENFKKLLLSINHQPIVNDKKPTIDATYIAIRTQTLTQLFLEMTS